MNVENFDKVVENRLKDIKRILGSKGKEYSSDTDRLYNFKRAAKMNNTTPEKALWGMATKHLVSVVDIIHDIDDGKAVSIDMIEEKIGDMINYLILLEALLKEDMFDNDTGYTDGGLVYDSRYSKN